MARTDTREKILDASLELFAQRGFEATGVRQIAEAVGIKPASLYKHFSGKQAIFEAIVQRMNERYALEAAAGLPSGTDAELAQVYGQSNPEVIAEAGMGIYRFWTEDRQAVLYRRMLSIEQHRLPEVAKINRRMFFEEPLRWQAALFERMMQAGVFKQDNPDLLALEFFAPIMMLVNASDAAGSKRERDRLAKLAHDHIVRFGSSHSCSS